MDSVIYSVDGPVAIVTINRPEKMNALNRSVREGLFAAFRRANADENCRVVILTGAGEKAFSAGGDLVEMAQHSLGIPPRDFAPVLRRNIEMDKPVIAAVNGLAWAGGFMLVQMCDLAFASRDATFAITEAKWSRGAPWAVPLTRMIPRRAMMELLLTAQPITAVRAYEVGLINEVCSDPESTLLRARAAAEVISQNAPLSIAGYLRMVSLADDMGLRVAEDVADAIFAPVYSSEDAKEGPRAFQEGRSPVWRSR